MHLVLPIQRWLANLVSWVTASYHTHHRTTGDVHVCQARYKRFPIQDQNLFNVDCGYVERNAGTANLIAGAGPYFSCSRCCH